MLIGSPDEVQPDLQWTIRIRDPQAFAERFRKPQPGPATCRGVVYVSLGNEDVEAVLVSLWSLRKHWTGPVCVLSAGDESGSLYMACTRLGVEFRNVPAGCHHYPDELKALMALDWSPFSESVFIHAATVVNGSPEFLFAEIESDRDHALCPVAGMRDGQAASTAVIAWRKGSRLLDALRATAAGLAPIPGSRPVEDALNLLSGSAIFHVLSGYPVWEGPAKRVPAGTWLQSLPLLHRAGGLHLYAPWAELEKEILAKMS